jgi:hypothetical protein
MRQRLAHCHAKVQMMRFLGMRTLTGFLAGRAPGPEGSIFKVYWSEYRTATELAMDIMGADGLFQRSVAVVGVPDRRCRRSQLDGVVGHHLSPPGPRSTPAPARFNATSWASGSSGPEGARRQAAAGRAGSPASRCRRVPYQHAPSSVSARAC